MREVLLPVLIGMGMSLIAVGVLMRARKREQSLAEILDLPFGEQDVAVEAITETRGAIAEGAVSLAGRMVTQFDAKGSLSISLERARIPLKAGEYVVVVACGGIVGAVLLGFITGQWLFSLISLVMAPVLGRWFPNFRINRRRKAFERQLPDALSLIASSLSAGHTFLRAIQMMCEESDAPLSEEFARVVYETRLGDPVVDALGRMAVRLGIRDLQWVVQAIRIQQTVGGKLADLLHTLADFIRGREEIRREIAVLTAEGRISAWVLGAMPIFLLFAVQVVSPGYMAPLFKGWGIAVLAFTGMSIAIGTGIILRMVKIEV
jgi:tight adherence protein B